MKEAADSLAVSRLEALAVACQETWKIGLSRITPSTRMFHGDN